MSEKPTLLEDLETAARYAEEDAANALSIRLRDHARRLAFEMKTSGQHRFKSTHALEVWMTLERINAGPLETP